MMNVFLPADRFVGRLVPSAVNGARCTQLLRELDARGFARTGELYPDDYRNNDRVVFDDAGLAAELEDRVRPYIPDEIVDAGARWRLLELNARFRACRYANGQQFCVHRDGAYVPSDDVRSFLTVQLYLDDDARRVGGRTRFYANAQGGEVLAAITPTVGSVIIFDHRVWHDGEPVTRGIKHVLRTDAVYQRVEDNGIEELGVVRRHRGYVWCAIACRDGSIASSGRDGTVRRGDDVYDLCAGSITTIVEADDGSLWCGSRAGSIHRVGRVLTGRDDIGRVPTGRDDIGRDNNGGGTNGGRHDIVIVMRGLGAILASANSRGLIAFATARGQVVTEDWRVDADAGWAHGICAYRDAFASCGHDGRVVLIDRSGRAREHAALPTPLRAIVFDGEAIHVGDDRGWVHTLAPDGSILRSKRTHASAITSLAVHGGGIVSAGEDGYVKRGDQVLCELRDFVTCVASTKRGLIVAGYDGAVRVVG
jgi:hypothetical protein